MHTSSSALNARDCGASGSDFETRATSKAGSNLIEVADIGDFKIGQWIVVSRGHIHYSDGHVYNTRAPWLPENQASLADEVELRGFDGCRTDWQVFCLHMDGTPPKTFRWLVVDPAFQPNHRRWTWQGQGCSISNNWQPLQDGVEIRFRKTDWDPGQVIAFHARNRLVSRIQRIEGRQLILEQAPTCTVEDMVVRHLDQFALQDAVGQAAAGSRNLFIPAGHYRLLSGLMLKDISIRIEGASREHTTLDISDGTGAVFTLRGGRDVAVHNLAMVGHTGFNELPWYAFSTQSGHPFWPIANQQMEVKGCAAANIAATERVLFEDLYVRRMAAEAFYSQGPDRFKVRAAQAGRKAQAALYTKSIIYNRCWVTDSASNAFNNNDYAENTSVLNCHVENVHNAWEGANRFTKFVGNYVKNAHCGSYVARHQPEFLQLGTGQALIANNVFEGGIFGQGLCIANGPTQIIIKDNLFVNFSNQKAIAIAANMSKNACSPRSVTVTGNIIDLTHVEGQLDQERVGIAIGAGNVIASNNQIYVRGPIDPRVTGIQVAEYAVDVSIHDNLIENCRYGLRTGFDRSLYAPLTGSYAGVQRIMRLESSVKALNSAEAFDDADLPGQWEFTAPYQGWDLHWLSGVNAGTVSRIAEFDMNSRRLSLEKPLTVQAGERFAVSPRSANWQIHHNTITGCREPVMLEGYGSATSRFTDNIINRGNVPDAIWAIRIKGRFVVKDNQLMDFDEAGAVAIEIIADARGEKRADGCSGNE
ncbi:MAG: right-handed parallel beta-helix repeat-containing protein [Kiritimatiellae bacterium]|nr:right-handed parallel beta-helix repeat-containing protein [Kiritimatiellia bacterium]